MKQWRDRFVFWPLALNCFPPGAGAAVSRDDCAGAVGETSDVRGELDAANNPGTGYHSV